MTYADIYRYFPAGGGEKKKKKKAVSKVLKRWRNGAVATATKPGHSGSAMNGSLLPEADVRRAARVHGPSADPWADRGQGEGLSPCNGYTTEGEVIADCDHYSTRPKKYSVLQCALLPVPALPQHCSMLAREGLQSLTRYVKQVHSF